jgi:hypothetical protein
MITSLTTTHPREVGIICAYTYNVFWAEHFAREAMLYARIDPSDPHLEVLDDLVELYHNAADRYVPHLSCEIMLDITRQAMRGEISLQEALFIDREGYAAFKRAGLWDI